MAKIKVNVPAEIVKKEPKPGSVLTAPMLRQRFNELVDTKESIDGELSYAVKPSTSKEDLEALIADHSKFISILSSSKPGHALLNGAEANKAALEALVK